MKKKDLVFWIIFPIVSLLVTLFMVFYLDLANGPLVLFIIELIAIAAAITIRILLRHKKFAIRMIPSFSLLITSLLIISIARPISKPFKAYDTSKPIKTEVMQLEDGKIQGAYTNDKKVEIYAGIPYAKAPIGDLRWKEPQDITPWDGVKDCTYFAAREMQVDTASVISTLVDMYSSKGWHPDYIMNPLQNMSEDCLYLNIWKPNTDKKDLPILFYIHGGSLTTGSSAFADYNGETLARNDVITITIGYRLGIFGYYADKNLQEESVNNTTGNYGLLDQIKALKWVSDNASYFGGDKNNITIAGESAGSSCVSALCTSPLAKGLFKRAIGASSSLVVKTPPHTFRQLDKALEKDRGLYEEFKCTTLEELRKIPASKLVSSSYAPQQMTIDGYALTKTPYEVYLEHDNNEEELLNGFNVKEADAFVVPTFLFSPTNKNNIKERLAGYFNEEIANKLMDVYSSDIEKDAFSAFNEIISVYWFMQPHQVWSKMAIDAGVKVYRYQFTKDNKFHGNYHSGELPYAYGNLHRDRHSWRYNSSDYELSEKMVSYWANFAKTGNPNYEGGIYWPEYNLSDKKIMELGDNVSLIDDPYLRAYPIIDEYVETKSAE